VNASAEVVWCNGKFVRPADATIPYYDAGFLQGVVVSERLRTFAGKLFEMDRHLDRLENSLAVIGVDCGYSRNQIAIAATELVDRNFSLIDSGGDLGLTLFVTPGDSVANRPNGLEPSVCSDVPRVVMHTSPLNFKEIASLYAHGQRLRISSVRQVPPSCWPASLKCRSRMHYYRADKEARMIEPTSRALLLDQDGFVSEASTANIVFYFPKTGLVVPKLEKILPGVTMAVLTDLANDLNIPFSESDLLPDYPSPEGVLSISDASEAFLVSTSPCLWPVSQIDDQKFPIAGPTYQKLLAAWCDKVGLDIRRQANATNV
jgi:branched-chain amino acid aminotransferase